MLSGMRREKEAPVGFDIDNYSTNSGKIRLRMEKIRNPKPEFRGKRGCSKVE
jgi:hypothetical protein